MSHDFNWSSFDADLVATAFHEAGHAVAALAVGRIVERVTIVPGKTFAGLHTLGKCQIPKGRYKPSKDWLTMKS